MTTSSIEIVKRLWSDRTHLNLGWLSTYHTFPGSSGNDPYLGGWGPLRVLGEDRVKANTGFGR
jgi:hypothetical protein